MTSKEKAARLRQLADLVDDMPHVVAWEVQRALREHADLVERPSEATGDLVTQSGLCLTEGHGCWQVSDQVGGVVEIPFDEGQSVARWLLNAEEPQCPDEPSEDARDAARYRWLKANHLQTSPDSWIRTGEDLEEAIDEAMHSETKSGDAT